MAFLCCKSLPRDTQSVSHFKGLPVSHCWSYCVKPLKPALCLSRSDASRLSGLLLPLHNPWFKGDIVLSWSVSHPSSYLQPVAPSSSAAGGGVVFINDYNCVTVTFPDLLAVTRGLTLFACPAHGSAPEADPVLIHWRRRSQPATDCYLNISHYSVMYIKQSSSAETAAGLQCPPSPVSALFANAIHWRQFAMFCGECW